MKTIKFILFLLSIFVLLTLHNMYRFGYGFNDAAWRTAMRSLAFEGTIWSKHFDENNFSKIKIGTSSDKVVSLLGPQSGNTAK